MSKHIRYIIRSQIAEEASGKTWDTATDGVMSHITFSIRNNLRGRLHRPILDNVFLQVGQDLKND